MRYTIEVDEATGEMRLFRMKSVEHAPDYHMFSENAGDVLAFLSEEFARPKLAKFEAALTNAEIMEERR